LFVKGNTNILGLKISGAFALIRLPKEFTKVSETRLIGLVFAHS